MAISFSNTWFSLLSKICPTRYTTIDSSTVNILSGRILLLWLSPPAEKSNFQAVWSLHRILIGCYLTEDDVITAKVRKYQRRPAFRLAKIRERKVENYDIASYKLAQAASSSGVSHSLESTDSEASIGNVASACAFFSDRTKLSNLSNPARVILPSCERLIRVCSCASSLYGKTPVPRKRGPG